MRSAYVVGTAMTRFQRWPDATHVDLARQALDGALRDAGLDEGAGIDVTLFGNCALHLFGQPNIRGQVVLQPLLGAGRLSASAPIVNVEAGCATGGVAFHQAWQAVVSGEAECALALGVEKTFIPSAPAKMFELFEGGLNQLDAAQWKALCGAVATESGLTFAPSPERITLLDVSALIAEWHMKQHGTSARALAAVASKNHAHGALNPNAQYRMPMSTDAVLADKPVVGPFTRAMCAPISDGAAAALVCSADFLERCSVDARFRALRVASVAMANGTRQHPREPSVTAAAAARAYARADVSPDDVDVGEVHDATAFSEIAATEALGFCAPGQGGPLAESGATSLGGARPINLSGGLESKGHPLAASGLAMVHEITTQLRGEAGERQAANARLGLVHNAGGLIGFDEAVCVVALLMRTR